jgi:hypothetical protein
MVIGSEQELKSTSSLDINKDGLCFYQQTLKIRMEYVKRASVKQARVSDLGRKYENIDKKLLCSF